MKIRPLLSKPHGPLWVIGAFMLLIGNHVEGLLLFLIGIVQLLGVEALESLGRIEGQLRRVLDETGRPETDATGARHE